MGKVSQNLSPAAVVIGALRINCWFQRKNFDLSCLPIKNLIRFLKKQNNWSFFCEFDAASLRVKKDILFNPNVQHL